MDAPIGLRYSRWWTAYSGGGTVYLPLVMADSGHQHGYGPVSYYSTYKSYLDAELARPPGAELHARAVRAGSQYQVTVQLVNYSGVTLSTSNSASVQVLVYEDIKSGVTSRKVLDAVHRYVTSPIADGEGAAFTLDTNILAPSDWSKVHIVAFAEYRPGGTTGAYDMLQAAIAVTALPPPADFTGDLTSDLLWRGPGGDLWLWGMENAAHATDAYVGIVADPNWEIRAQADVNGDGMADLVWRHKLDGTVYYWQMDGATPTAELFVATVDVSYDIVGTGDFDGDGKADLLWRNPALGDLWLWRMNGAEVLGQQYIDTVDLSYAIKGLGDVNGDFKTDVIWQGAAGDLWVWLMNGAVKDAQAYVGTVADATYQLQQVADFDADLKADLLWWNTVAGDVWIWRLDGADVLSEHYVGLVANTNYRIQAAGDYNGDQKADILWRNIVAGDLWVWLMDGAVKASEAYLGTVADAGYQIVK